VSVNSPGEAAESARKKKSRFCSRKFTTTALFCFCWHRLERERLDEEQRLKAEQEVELEREEAARQEAERKARDEEKRQEEWLRHQQELQDKLRQGLNSLLIISYL